MKKISKKKDSRRQNVIYVRECDKYEYEDPEIPKKSISDLHNSEFAKICDIIEAVESYFCDNGE